jgi:single-strand DNA-binding protein
MYQKIVLVGNLGRDPEMRYTSDGTPVTNFSIATTEKWTGQDGQQQERTTWWRVSVWGRQAEPVNQYLSKGRQVLVEGRMNPDPETGGPRVYTRNDGSAGASYEVRAITVRFLGGRADAESIEATRDDETPPEADMDEDSIPF